MAQATISIRVDRNLKSNFDSLCEAFGLSATAAFNLFMKAVVREKRIPFEIRMESPEDIRRKAIDAFNLMRESTASCGDISLEEINAEIKNARDEKKRNHLRGN